MFDFFKSIRNVRRPTPVNLERYPARTKKEVRMIDKNPYGDSDKDKLMNWFDCRPLDKKKQGFEHQYSYNSVSSKKIKTVKMPPELFLKTTYGEWMRRARNKEEAEENIWPYNRYKDNLLRGASGIIHKEKKYTYDKDNNLIDYPKRKKEIGIRKRIEGTDEYGKHVPVPFLQFDERGKQYGHEGRHTALVAQRMGLSHIPVTIEKPKDTKLTTKYERLEAIKGKQYSDWTYNEEKKEMNTAPIINVEEKNIPKERIKEMLDSKKRIMVSELKATGRIGAPKTLKKLPEPIAPLSEISSRIVKQEDEGQRTEELNKVKELKKEAIEDKKLERAKRIAAIKERRAMMRERKKEKKEERADKREEVRAAKEKWSSMSDYEKYEVGKVVARDSGLPRYMEDRVANAVKESFDKQASE